MKIGYVLNVFPKLSEMFVLNEILELRRQGHEITIFSVFSPSEKVRHYEIDKYGLLKDTYYLDVRSVGGRINAFARSIGFFGWNYPAKDLEEGILAISAAKIFSKIAKRKKLDMIHAHFNTVSAQTAMLMSKKTGIPFTFTCHAFDIFVNDNANVLRRRVRESLAVVVESEFAKRYVVSLTGAQDYKVKVIHLVPNLSAINQVSREIVARNGVLRIISVARLVEKKGLEDALLAIKLLKQKVKYVIIGKGPLREKIENLVSSLGIDVEIISELPNLDTLRAVHCSDIFLLPCVRGSNNDMDGTPTSIIEAMALGIPVITTSISGIPEMIEDEKTGLIVEQKNPEAIAKAIERVIKDRKLRSEIVWNAKKKIASEFNPQKEVSKLFEIWSR